MIDGSEMCKVVISSKVRSMFFRKPIGLVVIVGVWLAVVGAGLCAITRHSAVPGPRIQTGAVWPVSARLQRSTQIFTLVMVLHPECPCSHASVNELQVLMTRCQGRALCDVLFVEPAGLQEDSAAAELRKSAAGIAGVCCVNDPKGEIASGFGAKTSGQVFLYDSQGVLRFDGGITMSRGHAGDSDGLAAIEAIVGNTEPATRHTPVFGCSLW